MRFLIAGVLFAAFLVSGCTPASCEWSPPGPDVRSRPAAASALVPGPAAEAAEGLAAAGGGRPRTGYPGLAAAFYSANDKNLSSGWGADLNCVLNVGEEFSVEAALGTVHYNLESGTRSGGFSAVTFGALAQYGRPRGTSRWYVGAGAAWWMNGTNGLDAVGVTGATDSLAWIVEGGVEFQVASHANVDLEFRYTFSRSELSNGDDLDLNAFAARVNYVLLF